ncbi:MAG TPA: YggS family pyridoxal phosphate-dependent enzyme [Chitinophagaceae bacterium]|nr:YggS family pyridoxal phosphate-dependent enzyme [Chitinophagaceae bacterium]
MAVNKEKYFELKEELDKKNVTLIAVSKTKPAEDILELYNLGHRDFGENYVQELLQKHEQLPKDILWHFIGHLQSNKAKYIVPFVHLIHGIDSARLLQEVNKQAAKINRVVHCLLQVHIAREETKFGLDDDEVKTLFQQSIADNTLPHVAIKGLMGMASFTDDAEKIRIELQHLKSLFNSLLQLQYNNLSASHHEMKILSMGMSSDYNIAIEEDSNMVRIGSLLFGARDYNK